MTDQLWGLAGAVILLLVGRWLQPRARIIYGRANNSRNVVFTADPEETEKDLPHEIYVEKYFLQNTGKATARNVEFVLSSKPTSISVYPPMAIRQQYVGDGQWHIEFPQIAPRELVIIDCLYINQKAAWISSVKSAESVGKSVAFWTVINFGPKVNFALLVLMFLGVAFILNSLLWLL